MSVTQIQSRRRHRGQGRAGTPTPAPGTPEYLEAQAARWPEHAVELRAEAARLRTSTEQAA